MKIEFDKNGVLTISPENYLEVFALKQWRKGWHIIPDPEGDCQSVLSIQCELKEDYDNKFDRQLDEAKIIMNKYIEND